MYLVVYLVFKRGLPKIYLLNNTIWPPKSHQNAIKWQFCQIFLSIIIKFCQISREITINFYLPLVKSTYLYKPLGKSKQKLSQIEKYAKTPAKSHFSK